jgi:Arc/MetJ-type ribon-helix-helix transcriptional regulator
MKERAISVRLDGDAQAALQRLTSGGRSRSAAIRDALVEAARRRDRTVLASEAAAVARDEADRKEMVEVAALMESLRAEG